MLKMKNGRMELQIQYSAQVSGKLQQHNLHPSTKQYYGFILKVSVQISQGNANTFLIQ